jgi:hypothetical protein
MDWIPYLPPFFSLYLLVISELPKGYIKRRIADFVSRPPVTTKHIEKLIISEGLQATDKDKIINLTTKFWKSKESVIQNITLDWSARFGFFSSIFAAMFSLFSILSRTQSVEWIVGIVALFLSLLFAMLWWIMMRDIDELVSTKTTWNLSPADWCKIVLGFVNAILIVAIFISQRYSLGSSVSQH